MDMPTSTELKTDVLIIGSGLAGLSVALSLPNDYKITLISKSALSDCASALAQGGIAAVLDPQDQLAAHINDTLIAGAGLCQPEKVAAILQKAPDAIQWLCTADVPFTRENDNLHLTREGGHSQRRIAHAADHTGFSIIHTLQQKIAQQNNIQILANTQVNLLQVDNTGCYGAEAIDAEKNRIKIHARATVLACGGLGQLFSLTTNPLTACGEGITLAAQAGCRLRQLAFVQFHPTALAKPMNPCFLISEAVRGEGGILRNHKGERFMALYDDRLELAPRDIVARAIATEMKQSAQNHVFLDVSHLDKSFILEHFPNIYQNCLTQQLDITHEWIPVAPAAHYCCGGIVTDLRGRTDIHKLYAVGENACTGLHGANRLASNSLLECVVLGRAAAQDIIQQFNKPIKSTAVKLTDNLPAIQWSQIQFAMQQNLSFPDTVKQPFSFVRLQQLMSQNFGICRESAAMQYLWQQLVYWFKHNQHQHQIKLSLMTALLMVYEGLNLTKNQGAHFNLDNVD